MTIVIAEKYRELHKDTSGKIIEFKIRSVGNLDHNRFDGYEDSEIEYCCKRLIAREFPNKHIMIFKKNSDLSIEEYYKTRNWDKLR